MSIVQLGNGNHSNVLFRKALLQFAEKFNINNNLRVNVDVQFYIQIAYKYALIIFGF